MVAFQSETSYSTTYVNLLFNTYFLISAENNGYLKQQIGSSYHGAAETWDSSTKIHYGNLLHRLILADTLEFGIKVIHKTDIEQLTHRLRRTSLKVRRPLPDPSSRASRLASTCK